MKIAIFGAGQLAMMMIQADSNDKHSFIVIDPVFSPPASHYAEHIQSEYNDTKTLERISKECDVATIDFENVDVSALKSLEKYIPVHPSSSALEICQDRLKEKNLFKSLDIKTTTYFEINSMNDIDRHIDKSKNFILKSRRFGYDGKNQYRIKPYNNVETNLINSPCILEELVDFKAEVSLICLKTVKGETLFYPIIQNTHEDGILNVSIYPSNFSELQEDAEMIGKKLLDSMDYIGVLVVEFFINQDGQLIANEMAPRVHNSGHWTIEGANISQFSAHIKAITDGSINSPLKAKPSVMFNVLSRFIPENKIKKISEIVPIHLHDYHKTERENRKLGHLTYTCDNKDTLEMNINKIMKVF